VGGSLGNASRRNVSVFAGAGAVNDRAVEGNHCVRIGNTLHESNIVHVPDLKVTFIRIKILHHSLI